jgi:hypothetical protein
MNNAKLASAAAPAADHAWSEIFALRLGRHEARRPVVGSRQADRSGLTQDLASR